jgi:hypothetical protein
MSPNRLNSIKLQGGQRDVVGELDEIRKEDVLDHIHHATLTKYLVENPPVQLECAEFLAQFRRRFAKDEDIGQGEGDSRIEVDAQYQRTVNSSTLNLLTRQLAVVEFRVVMRLYQSNIAHLSNSEGFASKQGSTSSTDDIAIRTRWDHELRELVYELLQHYGRADRDEDADLVEKRLEAHASASRHEVLTRKDLRPAEFNAILIPLLSHLYQATTRRPDIDAGVDIQYRATPNEKHRGVGVKWKVSSINRSLLHNWQTLLEQAKLERSPLNCYPYVRFEVLEHESKMLMVCVTPLDAAFVDPRVEDAHRIAGVTLAVFDIEQFGGDVEQDELSDLAVLFQLTMARLSNTIGCFRSQQALMAAAGEATEISRFWYGTGVDQLLGARRKEGMLEEEDTLDLWDRFVSQLLCANIPGVTTVETFPFDRAYLFECTGASEDNWHTDGLRVRVLEAGLKSNAPVDRGGILTALERGKRSLSDFDVTQKSIVDDDRNEFIIRYSAEERKLTLAAAEASREATEARTEIEWTAELSSTEARTIAHKLRTLLSFTHRDISKMEASNLSP